MARTNRKRRQNKRLYTTIAEAEKEIQRQQTYAEENLCVSGLYGSRVKDPTARKAINSLEQREATI